MDNGQYNPMNGGGMPPMQPTMGGGMAPGGSMMQNNGMASGGGVMPNGAVPPSGIPNSESAPSGIPTVNGVTPNGMPMIQQVQVMPEPKKDIAGLVKTIVIVVVSLIAVTFIGLFIWIMIEYSEVKDDVEGQKAEAVTNALDEQATKMEAEFLEREKYPYKTFSGPIDYGQLTFEYPKTWSVYIAAAATAGGDFNAYFNPVQVDAVGKETINALRVTIQNKSFDAVTEDYEKAMKKRNSNLTVESVTIGVNNNVVANRYTGTIPGTELSGYIVTFKIRDKTVIMQTDSELFRGEYDKLLTTITFNE